MSNETEALALLGDIYKRLRQGEVLTAQQTELLSDRRLTLEQQCSALAGLTLRSPLHDYERACAIALAKRNIDVATLLRAQHLIPDGKFDSSGSSYDPAWANAFASLLDSRPLNRPVLEAIISDIVSNSKAARPAAALLMIICVRGMQEEDVVFLTTEMAHSGSIFDYRLDPTLKGARLVRRYPTGALSEKTALILPALIGCARTRVNVCSPFLVARSLGYTGGTWDKLRAIAGFSFPEAGDETIEALSRCGVAMTVTKDNANPADRFLYQLRSVTGTIESGPLIISSIASKHICFPVHRLLLDVRYGSGAFLSSRPEAENVGDQIERVLCTNDVPTFCAFTDTIQPTGSSVGNALEVAEAIAVMGGPHALAWDSRGIDEQRRIVFDLFAQLMAAEFPEIGVLEWTTFAVKAIQSGDVMKAFASILLTHKVAVDFVQPLFDRPLEVLSVGADPIDVRSIRTGTLKHLDQRKLGEIVNRRLGAGGNLFEGEFDPKPGIMLLRRLGDQVQQGEVLCRIFAHRDIAMSATNAVQGCFTVA